MALLGVFGPGVVVMLVAVGSDVNFASAVFLRRYGLLAAILVRLGYYLVWHSLYGNVLESLGPYSLRISQWCTTYSQPQET